MDATQADSVIAEVRAVRDGIAAQSNYDVGVIFDGSARCRTSPDESTPASPGNRIVEGSGDSLAVWGGGDLIGPQPSILRSDVISLPDGSALEQVKSQ